MRMRVFSTIALLAVSFLLTACVKRKMAAPPPPYPGNPETAERLQESLFKGDQAVLSNQEIERILGGHVTITDRHRLAILSLGTGNYWSSAIADADAQNQDRLLEALKSSPQLTQVRFMPSLLIPEKRTIPYLREAAARFQADLLLIYSTRIQTFRQDRLIGSDEVRARCLGESVLLDVRSGIVVHTGNATESISVKRTSADLNFSETVAKAQSEAVGKALLSLAMSLTTFMAGLPK